jgi:putative Mg2+ transporter-C (MgtC) family protein
VSGVDIPSTLELCGRIGLAAALGGAVGFEREINDHPAGLRTHIAVAVGAALFGIVSAYAFTEFDTGRNGTTYQVDVTRVASQVVTGMGFLGGGAILKYGPNVKGLTTAASIWVTAAIGLAVAFGSYTIALVTTGVILLSLVVLRVPARYIEQRFNRDRELVVVHLADGAKPSTVIAAVAELEHVDVSSLHVVKDDNGVAVHLRVRGGKASDLERDVAPLGDLDDVAQLEVT